MITPLFLRDLQESMQREYIIAWKKDKKEDLINANNNSEDIVVGSLFQSKNCKLAYEK